MQKAFSTLQNKFSSQLTSLKKEYPQKWVVLAGITQFKLKAQKTAICVKKAPYMLPPVICSCKSTDWIIEVNQ